MRAEVSESLMRTTLVVRTDPAIDRRAGLGEAHRARLFLGGLTVPRGRLAFSSHLLAHVGDAMIGLKFLSESVL